MRIRSSSSDRKNLDRPGSPWRPERPRSWLSIRRELVALGAEHVEAAGGDHLLLLRLDLALDLGGALGPLRLVLDLGELLQLPHLGVAAELDVGAAAGHVGRDRHPAEPAGLGDDERLLLMVARVQHLMRDLLLLEQGREMLRLLDADRADQDRLAVLVGVLDAGDDRLVLLARGPVDLVVLVVPDHRHVGRDLDHVELVDLAELGGFGRRRAGHAGELRVEPEVVLEGDRGQRLVLRLDRHLLLGLERLMQAVGVAPALHHPAGELVDDHDLAVLDQIVDVAGEQAMRPQRLVDVMDQRDVGDVVELGVLEQARLGQPGLHLLAAALGQRDRPLLLVLLVVVGLELRDVAVDGQVQLRAFLARARDDQGRARLVDQDAVDLVDDREVEAALDQAFRRELHIVAEVVEAELVVGAVGDVGAIGPLALGLVQAGHDAADREAEELVDLAHPAGIAPGQIVVDGDHVDALAGQRVEIDRERRDQGLAFAGLHLGDLALMEDHAAHQLHVEMALAEGSLGRLAHGREGFLEQVVEGLAGGQPLAEALGPGPQIGVRERLELGLESVDGSDRLVQGLDDAVVGRAEQPLGESANHGRRVLPGRGRDWGRDCPVR